jgi:hypothetical protein
VQSVAHERIDFDKVAAENAANEAVSDGYIAPQVRFIRSIADGVQRTCNENGVAYQTIAGLHNVLSATDTSNENLNLWYFFQNLPGLDRKELKKLEEKVGSVSFVEGVKEAQKALFAEYPLLSLYSAYDNSKHREAIIDYISLIDARAQKSADFLSLAA